MSEPFVVVSIPIRNRAWAVPLLRRALAQQTRTVDRALFITGDNEDGTLSELLHMIDRVPMGVHIVELNTGCPAWKRDGSPRYSLDDHANLAVIYNRGIEEALSRWPQMTHLWLLDSDVIPRPDVLELLLEARLEVVSAMVRNSPGALNFMLGMDAEGNPRRTGDELGAGWMRGNPFNVTFVSACTLVEREWLELGARFAPHPRSHDFPFVAALEGAGAMLWIHPRAETAHYFFGPDKGPLLP